jgi:hypothetical protein
MGSSLEMSIFCLAHILTGGNLAIKKANILLAATQGICDAII